MLFPEVASQLRWYFGQGQSITGHSPIGSMLDRASTYDNTDQFRDAKIKHGMMRQAQIRAEETPMSFKGDPEITARPTAEVRPAPSNNVNDDNLFRFAAPSRGLERLRLVRVDGPVVLKARYGEGIEEWEVKGFALGGLYPLIKSGRELSRKILEENERRGARLKMSMPETLYNEYRRAQQEDETERLCEFGQAHGDASRLLAEVVEVWNKLHEE